MRKFLVFVLITISAFFATLFLTSCGLELPFFDLEKSEDEIHRHVYSGTLHGEDCDPNGYILYTCPCGDSYVVKNYRDHVFVNGTCIYCGKTNYVFIEGYTYASGTHQNGDNNELLTGVTVTLTSQSGTTYETVSDEYGFYRFENLLPKNYTLSFYIDGYFTLVYEVEAFVNISDCKVFLDLEQSSVLNGKITVADYDTDYSNNTPLANATVTIVKLSGTNAFSGTTYTLSDGSYSFINLTSGLYKITIEKDGYIILSQIVIVDEGAVNISNGIIELVEDDGNDEPGIASGMVYDAAIQGDVGVEGLTLSVRAGLGNTTGEILLTETTGYNGSYVITGLPSGNYTVYIEDRRVIDDEDLRYSDSYFNIKIIQGRTIPNQNGSVSNGVFFGQIRIVLEWGVSPSDLDSHLTGPTMSSSRFHVYYSNKTYNSNGNLYSDLDRDDTDSYGPETTTIYTPCDGIYRFSIHDFTNKNSSSSNALARSGATVKVYFGGTLRYTFNAPLESGTLWTVFEYNSVTGILTSINTMSYQSDPAHVS